MREVKATDKTLLSIIKQIIEKNINLINEIKEICKEEEEDYEEIIVIKSKSKKIKYLTAKLKKLIK